MNSWKPVLESLKGKVLKNVVITVAVGGSKEKHNVAAVNDVGDLVELTVESIDHRSKDVFMKCFIRECDISQITFPPQEEKVVLVTTEASECYKDME